MDWDTLKKTEEEKREAAYDPARRWQHIQQTITWAEANMPLHLRRNRPRIHPSTQMSASRTSGMPLRPG